MRSRTLLPLLSALLAFTLVACGGGDGKITIGAPGERTESTDEAATDESTDDSATDDTTFDDSITGDESLDEMLDESGIDLDSALPEGSDLAKCIEISESFSTIGDTAAGMTPEEAASAMEDMKAALPPELSDDIETMVEVYADPMAMSDSDATQKLMDATTAITEYLTEICGAG